MNDFVRISKYALKDLSDALGGYGALGIIKRLLDFEQEHLFLLESIRCGFGRTDPDPNEDAAKTLAELRDEYAIKGDEVKERSLLYCEIAELIHAAKNIVDLYELSKR